MRTTLFALTLLLSTAAYAADQQPAGDAPSKEAKADAAKPDPDTVKLPGPNRPSEKDLP